MKLSDSIKYSWIKTIRDKKNIYFIMIFIICSILIIGAISFSKAFFTEVNRTTVTNISSRTLYIVPNKNSVSEANKFMKENLNKVLKLDHVLEIPPNVSFVRVDVEEFKSSIHTGDIELIYGNENSLPENVIGEKFKSDDTGVAICPINFFPGSMMKYPKGEKNIFINGYDLLNKTFESSVDTYNIINQKVVKTGTYKKKFKVIGLYNTEETGGWLFQCYVPIKDIDDIYNHSIGNLTNTDGETVTYPSSQVLIDKYENVEKVKKELIKMGFDVDYLVEPDINFYNSIKLTCLVIILVAIISMIFLTIAYVKKKNLNDSLELGVLKSLGYFNKDIIITNTIQILIMSLLSYIISITIFAIGILFIKNIMRNYLLYTQHGYYLDQYLITYVLTLIITLLLTVISTIIYTNKIAKKSSNLIIKGDNL